MSTATSLAIDRSVAGAGRPLRIAVVNWGRRSLGGAESYIAGILPELKTLGHELAFWSELDEPSDRDPIPLPEGTRQWCAAEIGMEPALAALREWGPDLLFVQVISRPEVEAAVLGIGPAVLFAHGYLGACISGERMLKHPTAAPCSRRFGPACLLHYHAERCGGLSPLTMMRDYRKNARRRDLLPSYRAIIANSAYVRDVYAAHVTDGTTVHALPLPVSATETLPLYSGPPAAGEPWRILFTGRMAELKGGRILLEALPDVAAGLDRPVHVTFAGDGPERANWERLGQNAVALAGEGVAVEFVGWKDGHDLDLLRDRSHLLVVPSLWPEPFGLVGPEAGLRGLPAVAFASGGIPDWLIDGVNGYLAPANPPTTGGLAAAIVRSLGDVRGYAALREGAVREARRFSREAHVAALSRVFADAVRTVRSAS